MINNNLSLKLTGMPINNLKVGNVPKNAITYNLAQGFSNKKGRFEVISFFDKFGNLVRICIQHFKNGNVTETVSNYSSNKRAVHSIQKLNNKVTKLINKILYPDNFFTEETILTQEKFNIHQIGLLQKGGKSKAISYKTFFDGQKPVLNYHNITHELKSQKGLELLPLSISSIKEKCIEHLAKYRIREEKLEDIVPVAKSISLDELLSASQSARDYIKVKGKISGATDYRTGQVYIVDNNDKNIDLIDTVSHEYQHVKDISDTLRIEDNFKLAETYFEMRSMQRELIKKSDPEYTSLRKILEEEKIYNSNCKVGKHDDMECEKRAIAKGKEQTQLFYSIVQSVKDLLLS